MGFNWWRDAEQDDTSAQAIIDRVQAEWRARKRIQQTRTTDTGMWPTGWPHEAPDEPPSVPEAHRTMQRHRTCRTEECPRKAAAFKVLMETGKVTPDPRRAY
ncbi:hypothetical protein ACFYT3_23170 [Nocardia amikacinitolerans]|uniref:hypothetical protein n=1 Tax=Nocardia amikacinitolerans TaxID=756689 RepID=UPI0036950182